MYIINGIAYASELAPGIEVVKVIALDDMMLLLTFNTGEKRLYDATALLEYPAFRPLEDIDVFKTVKAENGIVIWLDGDIDIAPEALYKDSIAYQEALAY
jgi:K+ transporter